MPSHRLTLPFRDIAPYRNAMPSQRILTGYGSLVACLSQRSTRHLCTRKPSADNDHLFSYTSGRWLWDEEQRLAERYKRFNVDELKRVAAASVGAQSCRSIVKLAEGASSKTFRLLMDDESVVIARLPNPGRVPVRLATASQAATMDFLRSILKIPVPKILSWSPNPHNSVQSEYILMEEAMGTQLEELWSMEIAKKYQIVKDLTLIEKQLLSIKFTLYGNIYFARDAFHGCRKAEVGDVPQKEEIEARYVIGPVIDRRFWDERCAHLDISRGPWATSEEYLQAIAEREIACLGHHTSNSDTTNDFVAGSAEANSTEAYIKLYEKFIKIIPYLVPQRHKQVNNPTLWHGGFRTADIFVTSPRITSILGWHEAWTSPLSLDVQIPQCIDYNGPFHTQPPPGYDTMDQSDEKARIREQGLKSLMLCLYVGLSEIRNPTLDELYMHPAKQTRQAAVRTAVDGPCEGGPCLALLPFRECLIHIIRDWNLIADHVPCPISFSEEELKAHYAQVDDWNGNAEFWEEIRDVVRPDGWTANETYEAAIELFGQVRAIGLKELKGQEWIEFEKFTRCSARKDE